MPTFEEGFKEVESAADSVLGASNELTRITRQLKKAAQEGNIAALRRASERLDDALAVLRQNTLNAAAAWPFASDQERVYLQESYVEELKTVAHLQGLQVFERDGRLIAYPSLVRVLPGEKAVQINRRQKSTIRPSWVAAELQRLQKKPPKFRPLPFLESLYQAYAALTGTSNTDQLKLGGVGQVVQLMRIYELFTGLPGANREYSQLDFARDLYSLETSGTRTVAAGAVVSFPASTGTRGARNTLTFIGPDGESTVYYGIQFTGAGK